MTNVASDPLHRRLASSADRAGHWMTADDDREMQEEHGFVWDALLRTVGLDLTGLRILDAGCNQGGFLRLVADRFAIAEGRGYDPAAAAVAEAQARTGDRPLQF